MLGLQHSGLRNSLRNVVNAFISGRTKNQEFDVEAYSVFLFLLASRRRNAHQWSSLSLDLHQIKLATGSAKRSEVRLDTVLRVKSAY